jgi:hypothetical protein
MLHQTNSLVLELKAGGASKKYICRVQSAHIASKLKPQEIESICLSRCYLSRAGTNKVDGQSDIVLSKTRSQTTSYLLQGSR